MVMTRTFNLFLDAAQVCQVQLGASGERNDAQAGMVHAYEAAQRVTAEQVGYRGPTQNAAHHVASDERKAKALEDSTEAIPDNSQQQQAADVQQGGHRVPNGHIACALQIRAHISCGGRVVPLPPS